MDNLTQLNNSSNATQSGMSNEFVMLTIISKIVCVIILFVGIIGNSLVLIVFGSRCSRLKACEIFMISLAFADLIGTLVTPSFQLFETMGFDFAAIRDEGCQLIHFSIITSVTVSSVTLIAITFDRFVIVKWPLRERVSFSTLKWIVIFTWILGSGPGIIYLVKRNVRLFHVEIVDVYTCRQFIRKEAKLIHTLVTFCIQVVIPLVLMVVLYSLITFELWKTTKTRLFQMREREMRARYKRNKKAIKLLFAIVVVFFLCITPVNTFYVIYTFLHPTGVPSQATIRWFYLLQMLQMINSCVNPIIYSKLHTSFRRTTLKMFCWCCFAKVRNYQWEDFGGNVKSAMHSSIRFASKRLSRASLPFIKAPIPGTETLPTLCQNGNPYCKRNNTHRHCRVNGSPKEGITTATGTSVIPSKSPTSESPYNRKHRFKGNKDIIKNNRQFSLTRGNQYIINGGDSSPPPSYNEYIDMTEMTNSYPNSGSDEVFISTSIFPKTHCVKFDTQPLIDQKKSVAV